MIAPKKEPKTTWGPKPENAIQLKVALKHIRPPIWRRVLLPDNFTLGQLHEVIHATMGWYNCHMHVFRVPRRGFGPPLREFGSGLDAAENENNELLEWLEEGYDPEQFDLETVNRRLGGKWT